MSRKPGRKITKEMKGDERVVRRRKDERVVSLIIGKMLQDKQQRKQKM